MNLKLRFMAYGWDETKGSVPMLLTPIEERPQYKHEQRRATKHNRRHTRHRTRGRPQCLPHTPKKIVTHAIATIFSEPDSYNAPEPQRGRADAKGCAGNGGASVFRVADRLAATREAVLPGKWGG